MMTRLTWSLVALAFARAAFAQAPQDRPLPNIVYILADDLGYGDVRCLNPGGKIPTPNIDRLASEGATFKDAHSGSSVCSPTRYGLLTGRYCWRSALKSGVLGGYSPPLIEPGRLTVPALLKQHGYSTACFGKWHLGMTWSTLGGAPIVGDGNAAETRIDFTRPIADGPCTRGFDYYFGISASLDMPPYVFIENDRVVAQPTARQEAVKGQFVRSGPKDPAFRFDRVLPELTDRAVKYIGDRVTREPRRPFFVYLALNAPHTPIAPSEDFRGKSQAGDYGDFVAEVDRTVGQVLGALDENKVAGNTLVVLTSDNGPEVLAYDRARDFRHFSMGSLRGLKRDLWEGGHRVPFFVRWPGKVKPGLVSGEVICHTDLLATAAAIVGAELPNDAGEDSHNLLPAFLGETPDRPVREATVHHSASGKFAIRQGNWVLIDAPTGDDNRGREPAWLQQEREFRPHNLPGELYDLSKDLGERHNLYAENPGQVRQLRALLETYQQGGRSAPQRR
jgi:arylsulfatase A-like enzyme